MTEAAFTWGSKDGLVAAVVPPGGEAVIGRGSDAAVRVDDPAVSRRQARLISDGGRYLMENLSETNPTKLNDSVPESAVPLMDGDAIEVGKTRLTFHHLAAGDRLLGPICSHCGRENNSAERDCWFCGTSLVNAPSVLRTRRQVVARLIDDDGGVTDMFAGQAATISLDGAVTVGEEGMDTGDAIAVRAAERSLTLRAHDAGSVMVHRQVATDGQPLSTGDVITHGKATLLVVKR